MLATLEEILRTRTVCAPDGTKIPLDYAITAAEGEKLQELIIEKRPAVSLEVGLGFGISGCSSARLWLTSEASATS